MGWDYRWCMHGKREGVDSHDCAQCEAMAREMGLDCSKGATWLFEKVPAELLARRERAALGALCAPAEPAVALRV